jgi:hypothetical protein
MAIGAALDAQALAIVSVTAFFTAILSAVAGMAGGMTLLAVMLLFLPPLAAIPLHGAIQLAANSSRTLIQRGVDVSIFLFGRAAELRGDARANLDILGHLGLTVVEVTDAQARVVPPVLASLTGLGDTTVAAAFASGKTTVLMHDVDIDLANHIRDASLPGVHLVAPHALQRELLARIADIFFFTTISLGGLGLAGFVLAPRDPRRIFALLALLALAGVPLVFFGDARFHVPAMPLVSIAAAWTVVTAATRAPRFVAQISRRGSGVEVAEGERPVADQDALQDA